MFGYATRPREGSKVSAQITIYRNVDVLTFVDAAGQRETEREDIEIEVDIAGVAISADRDCGQAAGFELDQFAIDADGNQYLLTDDEIEQAEDALLDAWRNRE